MRHLIAIALLLVGCGGAVEDPEPVEPAIAVDVAAHVEQDAGAAVHTCMPVPDAGWVCSD